MQLFGLFSRFSPIAATSNKHIANFNKDALIEAVVFLSVMVLFSSIIGDGSRFITMRLHPFWIIVLLVTLQYGPKEAIAASLLASVFLLAGNLPEQNLTETMYEYILRVTSLPLLWIATALVLGSIRSRQIIEKQNMLERFTSAEEAKNAIAKAYNALKKTKEQLEMRLAEERRSVLTVYNIAKSLETLDPADTLAEVSKLVKMTFNPREFSLYSFDGKGLRLETSHGWKDPASYISQFASTTVLAHNILEKNKILCITNENDERILDGQGVLAGPILDAKTGKIFGMLKIEDIAFMDMGIRTHETFRIVCEWIGRVYANIEKHQSVHATAIQSVPEQNNEIKLTLKASTLPYPLLVPASMNVI